MRRKRCRNGSAVATDWRGEAALVSRPGFDVEVRRLRPAPRLFCKTLPLEIRLERRPRCSPTKVRSCRQSRGVIRGARDPNDQSPQRGSIAMIRSLETPAENPSALIGAMRTVAAVLDKIPQIADFARGTDFSGRRVLDVGADQGRRVSCDGQRDCVFFAPNTPFHGSFLT